MAGETDNLPSGGTDNAQPSTEIDNPANWNFWEPEEDNPETSAAKGTEGETGEDETVQETEESGDEAAEAADATETEDADTDQPDEESTGKTVTDDALVTLSDGSQVPIKELRDGYLRQADYTRKGQELANKRKDLDALTSRIQNTVEVFSDYLAKALPPEPDASLALTNPGQYVAQKANYDAAMAQVSKLLELGAQPKEVASALSNEDRSARLEDENRKLIAAVPTAATDKGRQEFFQNVRTAASELGFTDAELRSVTDHRILVLAHWARKGMAAEKARAAAKTKVADVPPVSQPKRQKTAADAASRNRAAMQRLSRTGSIRDALAIDFD